MTNQLIKKSIYVAILLALLLSFSSCKESKSIELEILNHSLNSVDDAWPYIYNLGEEIPGYIKEKEKITEFTVTVYRSIYEYDTMHPMVILFIEQPEAQPPCVYGIKISTADGTFNYGFGASPWHCLLLNSPNEVDVSCGMYLFGEDGEDILEEMFKNQTEDKMNEYSTQSMTYSLRIMNSNKE